MNHFTLSAEYGVHEKNILQTDPFMNRLGSIFRRPLRQEGGERSSSGFSEAADVLQADLCLLPELQFDHHRSLKFTNIIDKEHIDILQLQERLWSGCVKCEYRIRESAWKLILGYLPNRLDRQSEVLRRKRLEYQSLSNAFNANRTHLETTSASLDASQTSYRQIKIDIPRTCFYSIVFFKSEDVSDLMLRVLYIWSLRNPACSYVQGMNDVAVPTLIVLLEGKYGQPISMLNNDTGISQRELEDVEADLYWIISKLLQDLQDHYTSSQPGIQRMSQKLKGIIQRVDLGLFQHLEFEQVDFMQISFRWFNCLFTREFKHDCLLRLWDTCIAESDGFSSFLVYFAAALLNNYAAELKASSFVQIITLLNNSDASRERFDIKTMETLISEAYVLMSLFHSSPHHLHLVSP